MSPRAWWSSFLERRAAKHESPWRDEEMATFRCRVWPLVQQSQEQVKAAKTVEGGRGVRDLWRRLLRRDERQRRVVSRVCAEKAAARAVLLGVVNPADVPGVRRRSPDVGLVRPVVDRTARVLNDMPRHR